MKLLLLILSLTVISYGQSFEMAKDAWTVISMSRLAFSPNISTNSPIVPSSVPDPQTGIPTTTSPTLKMVTISEQAKPAFVAGLEGSLRGLALYSITYRNLLPNQSVNISGAELQQYLEGAKVNVQAYLLASPIANSIHNKTTLNKWVTVVKYLLEAATIVAATKGVKTSIVQDLAIGMGAGQAGEMFLQNQQQNGINQAQSVLGGVLNPSVMYSIAPGGGIQLLAFGNAMGKFQPVIVAQ